MSSEISFVSDGAIELNRRMNELWRRVGMDDNLISTRRARVAEEIETLMGNMLNEEEMMERKIRDNLLRFTEESRVVAIQLGMESEELNEVSVNCSNESTGAVRDGLVSQESRVRKLIIRLNDIKKKRSEVIENLVADGNRLCKSLGEDPLNLSEQSDLSQANIDRLSRKTADLKMKYDSRHAEFRKIRSSFLSFLKQNDLSPNDATTSFVCYEEPQYPLSQAYLEQMREIHHRNKAVHFRKEITKLWRESNLSAKETETFRAKYLEFPSKIEESLVNRLDKYSSELKLIVRGQLLKRMESAIANIKSLRSQAYMLDDDSMLGFDLYENGTNEQLRSHTKNFEKEAENIKRGMAQRARITKPLHDWDNSFEKLIELHQKSQDPERLKNRGGQLLRDERARKALKHQLVKQEKQILEISETNKGNDRFIINGKNLEEYFAAKWEDLDRIHSSFINNRKMKRKKQTEEEARYGSSNPKKSDLKKLLHPPASKKKRHDDRSMDDSSAGYITSWGDIRSYPVKSIVGKYASLPRKTNKEKSGAGTSAWTTDTMSNREDLIQQAKEIRKRRRRSKSESNIRNVFLTKGENKDYGQLRLHVPNADRLGNQVGYLSSLKDRQNATAAMFSETIQNEPHRSDDTIDHGLLAADEFVGEFNGVLKQQPNCRSSAIGVDFF